MGNKIHEEVREAHVCWLVGQRDGTECGQSHAPLPQAWVQHPKLTTFYRRVLFDTVFSKDQSVRMSFS